LSRMTGQHLSSPEKGYLTKWHAKG